MSNQGIVPTGTPPEVKTGARKSGAPKAREAITFKYAPKYGVIVVCRDEQDQEKVYSRLSGQGHNCKVVTV